MSKKKNHEEWKIFGTSVEEFLIYWNKINFQLGELNEFFTHKIFHMLLEELKVSLNNYPKVKELPIFIHVIDDNIFSIVRVKSNQAIFKVQDGILFSGKKELITMFRFLMMGFISQSLPFKERLDELKKSIIYPYDKLTSLFGIKE